MCAGLSEMGFSLRFWQVTLSCPAVQSCQFDLHRLKYLHNFWVGFNEIWCTHLWSVQDRPCPLPPKKARKSVCCYHFYWTTPQNHCVITGVSKRSHVMQFKEWCVQSAAVQCLVLLPHRRRFLVRFPSQTRDRGLPIVHETCWSDLSVTVNMCLCAWA